MKWVNNLSAKQFQFFTLRLCMYVCMYLSCSPLLTPPILVSVLARVGSDVMSILIIRYYYFIIKSGNIFLKNKITFKKFVCTISEI